MLIILVWWCGHTSLTLRWCNIVALVRYNTIAYLIIGALFVTWNYISDGIAIPIMLLYAIVKAILVVSMHYVGIQILVVCHVIANDLRILAATAG